MVQAEVEKLLANFDIATGAEVLVIHRSLEMMNGQDRTHYSISVRCLIALRGDEVSNQVGHYKDTFLSRSEVEQWSKKPAFVDRSSR